MTAFNYPNTAATAKRLLKRFGADCVIQHPSGTAYDPGTGSMQPTYASADSTAAVFAMPQKFVDGTLIKQGDQQAFCAPDVEILQGDTFTWQTVDYAVISVKPVAPAGIPVLYEAQIRG